MSNLTHPTIFAPSSAFPPFHFQQNQIRDYARDYTLGPQWRERPEMAENARMMERIFSASRVQQRNSVVNLPTYYEHPRSIGERMAEYETRAYTLAHEALERSLAQVGPDAAATITDFIVVSCTGYSAPGLDIILARDFGMPRHVRRVVVGHMGCYGAIVGLRQALAVTRADSAAVVAVLSVECSTLHFMPTLDTEALTSFALFGDAAAALIVSQRALSLSDTDAQSTVSFVDAYCATDYATAGQMSWRITDQGFAMGLSPRVPVSLRRSVGATIEQLLGPHGLQRSDVAHWLIHPGGPSIVEAVQRQLELSEEQVALSWWALHEHGNCSSATVLVMLNELLRRGETQPGEWGVMIAFGPGLTLETCLLRF